MALSLVNCKLGSNGGSITLPGAGKSGLHDLFGKGKCIDSEGGDIDTEYRNWEPVDYSSWLPKELPDRRIRYGSDTQHFAELRIPKTDKLRSANGYPVLVVIHGGAWRSDSPLSQTAPLAEALTGLGLVTWNIEFRRLGNTGGGYPNTPLDAGLAVDYLRTLAPEYNLDLSRVIILGHSSGGHLALWTSSRHKIDPASSLYVADPLPIKGVISLGSIANMQMAYEGGRADMLTFLGVETTQEAELLYPNISPYLLLPTGVPTSHFVGAHDDAWRINGLKQYSDESIAQGTPSHNFVLEGAREYDLIDPCSPAWPTLVQEVFWVMDEQPPNTNLNKSKFCPLTR